MGNRTISRNAIYQDIVDKLAIFKTLNAGIEESTLLKGEEYPYSKDDYIYVRFNYTITYDTLANARIPYNQVLIRGQIYKEYKNLDGLLHIKYD